MIAKDFLFSLSSLPLYKYTCTSLCQLNRNSISGHVFHYVCRWPIHVWGLIVLNHTHFCGDLNMTCAWHGCFHTSALGGLVLEHRSWMQFVSCQREWRSCCHGWNMIEKPIDIWWHFGLPTSVIFYWPCAAVAVIVDAWGIPLESLSSCMLLVLLVHVCIPPSWQQFFSQRLSFLPTDVYPGMIWRIG